jgi:uncharacterized protein YndB with AHSA1/START domain
MADTGRLKVTTTAEREVQFVRDFNAPARLVFDAHTKPELMKRWLLGPAGWTMPVCEVDLRVGGGYRCVWSHPDHSPFEITGVYQEIVAPRRIVNRESFNGEDPALCTLVLAEQNGVTTMTFTMAFVSRQARDAALQTGMATGMEQSYQRLDGMAAKGF